MLGKTASILIILTFASFLVKGQEQLPLSFSSNLSLKQDVPVKILPPIPMQQNQTKAVVTKKKSYLKSLEFGTTLHTAYSISDEGLKDTIKSNVIERLAIRSTGAKCLGIKIQASNADGFDSKNIYVYSANKRFVANTLSSISEGQTISLPIVPGDCAVVEIVKELGSTSRFYVTEVVHGEILPLKAYDIGNDLSQSCNVNVACPVASDWQFEKNGVVKIIIGTATSSRLCSGVLINNTAHNKKPYVLTANHCIRNQAEAQNSIFYFGYEQKGCGQGTIIQGQTISGASLVATGYQNTLDFTLLELSATPPDSYNPYYVGWDIRKHPFDKPGAVAIHHPNGDVKKISIDYQSPIQGDYTKVDQSVNFIPNTHWRVEKWDIGTTEGGSSGAPLFNMDRLIVGSLTGGLASCDNSIDDYFSMINAAWNSNTNPQYSLKSWLDPVASGDSTCASFVNNSSVYTIHSSSTVPCSGDTVSLNVIPQDANVTIKNLQAVNVQEISGIGTHKVVWRLNSGETSKDVVADIYLNGVNIAQDYVATVKGLPAKPDITLNEKSLESNSNDYLEWYYNGTAQNTTTAHSIQVSKEGAYYVVASSSFGCNTSSDTINVKFAKDIVAYPVPVTSGILHIKIQQPESNKTAYILEESCIINLYDLTGRKISTKRYVTQENEMEYDLSNVTAGLYILQIITPTGKISKKIVVTSR